jgi:hypothetical protein
MDGIIPPKRIRTCEGKRIFTHHIITTTQETILVNHLEGY